MSEDLKLDVLASLSKINSSTTDHPGTLSSSSIQKYTISAYDWYGKSVYRVYGWVPKNNNANVLQYTYYVNSGIYSSKLALANTSGTGSLCPAGWHLPNKNSHEFCNAARKYGRNYIGYDFANATGACRTITNAANPSYTNDFLPFYNNFKNTCNLPNAYSQTTYPNNDYYHPVTTYYGVLYNHDDSACREQWGATSPFGCTTNSEVSYGYANFWQSDGTAYGFTQGYVIPEGGGGGFPTYGVSDSAYGYDGLPLRCVKD